MRSFYENEFLNEVTVYPDWLRGERFVYGMPAQHSSLEVDTGHTAFWKRFIHIFS